MTMFCRSLSLDLTNFDKHHDQLCPYILTSPRSLEACRLLNIKPVDLLYPENQYSSEEAISCSSRTAEKLKAAHEIRDKMANNEENLPAQEGTVTTELVPPMDRPVSATSSTTISTASELSNSYSTDIPALKINDGRQHDHQSFVNQTRSFTPSPTRGRSRICKPASRRTRPLSEPIGGTETAKEDSGFGEKSVFSINSFLPMTRSISQMSMNSSSVISKLAKKTKGQIPKQDWRILECLFLKYKNRHQEELKSFREQKKWQLEREMILQESSKQWEEWQAKINAKRINENIESMRRWKKKEQVYLRRHETLMSHIKSKEKKLEKMHIFRIEAQIRQMNQQRAIKRSKRDAVILSKNLQDKEDELNKQKLLEKWKARQENLANKFKKKNEIRLMNLEREMLESDKKCEKLRELQERDAADMEAKRMMMTQKLIVTQKNLQFLQDLRSLSSEKAKCQRQLKQRAVLDLHDKLESEFNYWRERILQNQIRNMQQAEVRMAQNLNKKTARVQEKLHLRKHQQQQLMERIISKQTAEEQSARLRIEAKGNKGLRIAREREERIQISKETSVLCSLLREFMRNNKTY